MATKRERHRGAWRRARVEGRAARQDAKRARHRRRRSKLYCAFRENLKSNANPHRAYAHARRVVAARRRRRARRAARQGIGR